MRSTLLPVFAGASLFIANAAAADIQYTDQWRDVEAHSTFMASWEWIWATDFGPFSALVDHYSANPDGSWASGRYMSHSSRLDADRILFTGETRAGLGELSAGHSFGVIARSQVNATLTLAEATNYSASFVTTSVGNTVFDISLTRVGGATIFSGSGSHSGLLEPGEYTFRAFISAEGVRTIDPDSGHEVWYGSTAVIDAVLVIPAPGVSLILLAGGRVLLSRRRRGGCNRD